MTIRKIVGAAFILLTFCGAVGAVELNSPPKMNYSAGNEYMQIAIMEARVGIYNGHGGPFGSVVVKDGKIVGKGHNNVVSEKDPTWHGEIGAIRDACKKLNTFDLTGCVLYTTGEPCNMCLTACMWANIGKIYYGCTIEDNERIGFRDNEFDKIFNGRDKVKESGYEEEIDRAACLKLFDEYAKLDKTMY